MNHHPEGQAPPRRDSWRRILVARILAAWICAGPLPVAGTQPETAPFGKSEPASHQPGITLHPRLRETLEQARASGRRPRIGLALSGGGARGLAHVGVLAALEQIGIPVDRLAGTSMGAIVGGLYASGYSIPDIERIASESDWRLLFSDLPERRTLGLLQKERFRRTLFELGFERGRLGSTGGLVAGQRLSARFAALTLHVAEVERLDSLPVPFVCVATNVADGREVVLRTGPLHRAILASAAIPLVLQPVEWGDLRLIDGGLSNNLPVDRARELGADLVIAVDASEPLLPPEQIDSLAAVAEQVVSFPVVAGRDRQAPQADVLIVLGLGEHGNAEFSSSLAIMEAGRRFVTECADLLRPLAEVCKLPAPADAGGRNRAGAPGAGESARPPGQGPVIDEVWIEGGRRLRPEVLEEWVRVPIGAPLEAKALEEQIEAVYATGYFDAVEPSIETLPDGRHRLRLHLREKRALQVGVGLRYEDERGPAMLVTLGRFNFLGRDNGAYLDARWGTVSRLDLHYLQPSFPATSFFTSLRLSGVDDFRFVYGPRERRDRYMDRRLALDLAAGNTVRALGELSLAYRLERINFQPEEKGEPGLAGSEFSRLGMLSLRTRVDTLDDASIPTRGRRLRFALDAVRDGLGSEVRFNRARFEIAAVRGLGPGSAHLGLQLGTAFGGSLPQSEKLLLGGPQSLHGLHRAERRGDEMFAARAGWRAPLGTLPWMGGGRYYLGGVVDLGSAASERRELGRGSVLGAGVEFSADTRIGPLQVAFGQSEGGAETAYFSLGFPF